MKRIFVIVGLLVTHGAAAGAGAENVKAPTPAQKQIAWAEKVIQARPKDPHGYNQLAMGLARRARETADPAFYAQAETAVQKSLAIDTTNFEARKARAWVLLGKHEFAAALAEAKALNRQMPDDLQVYSYLVDANAELGNYKEAEEAGQWMLDLRPGAVAGLTRGAYLRELFGDVDGALELMQKAFENTPPSDTEDRAWVLTQVAHLNLTTGKLDRAEILLKMALQLFPDYHYSLGNLGRLRMAQGRHVEAVSALKKRYEIAPHPENLYELAEAYERAGMRAPAAEAFRNFERAARVEMESLDNANRELIRYYLGAGKNPKEALRIAAMEAARKRDVHTLDAHAWALYHNGRYEEARAQMRAALAVGIRDADMFYRAGAIETKLRHHKEAQRFFQASLQANRTSDSAPKARAGLLRQATAVRAGAR